jgi:hypothetical protein
MPRGRLRHTLGHGAKSEHRGGRVVRSGSVRRHRSGGPGAYLPLVSWRCVGPGLEPGPGLELESMPRLATRRGPGPGELGTVGASADLGAARTAPATVGAGRQRHVEPDGPRMGLLEQRHLADDLTERRPCLLVRGVA